MARITITKDPGYAASANVDGRVLTGDVKLEGETLSVGDQNFEIGSMRIIAESKEAQTPTPQPAADHPSMVGRSVSESAGGSTSGSGTASPGLSTGGNALGSGAIPAADGGNAPSTRSSR